MPTVVPLSKWKHPNDERKSLGLIPGYRLVIGISDMTNCE